MIDPSVEAKRLRDAFASRSIVPAPSTLDAGFDLDSAYAIQADITRMDREAGRRTIGWKAGYTNRAAWSAQNLQTLVWAHLYDHTVRYADWNDATLSIAPMIAPKIESTIVFKMAKAPESSDASAVLAATEWIALGFEIVDCVFPDWKFQPSDFVAARGFHSALIVGEPVYMEDVDLAKFVDDMASFKVRLLKNNEMVEEGEARNALQSPALCVAELAEALRSRGGETLQPGDLVATGTLTTALLMAADDTWIASLSGIPPSSLTLRVS